MENYINRKINGHPFSIKIEMYNGSTIAMLYWESLDDSLDYADSFTWNFITESLNDRIAEIASEIGKEIDEIMEVEKTDDTLKVFIDDLEKICDVPIVDDAPIGGKLIRFVECTDESIYGLWKIHTYKYVAVLDED